MEPQTGPDRASGVHSVRRTCEGAALALGVWCMAAPWQFALDFIADDASTFSTLGVGLAVAFGALLSMLDLAPASVGLGVVGLAGVWAVIAPYVLDFVGGTAGDAASNSIGCGVVLVVLSLAGYAAAAQDMSEQQVSR
jgi:SPW repeat